MIRYPNNNSLIVVLMLILFSATGAATGAVIDKAPPSLSVQRQLVWSGPDGDTPCDAATIANAQQLIDPFIDSCTESLIRWDPDSILIMVVQSFLSFSPPAPAAFYTIYYPIYGNKLCQSGNSCAIITEDFYVYTVYDEYAYDCSNIYCGPNAIRDCYGNSMTVSCTDSLVSLPEIPSNELVKCLKDRQLTLQIFGDQNDESCSECTDVGEDGNTFAYSCATPCESCFEDGSGNSNCRTDVSFTKTSWPQAGSTNYCETVGSAGKHCFTTRFTQELWDPLLNTFGYWTSECTAEWNGVSCNCSICGRAELSPLVIVDCSTDDVALAYDQCSMTSSGVYAGSYNPELQLGLDSCPNRAPTNPTQGCVDSTEIVFKKNKKCKFVKGKTLNKIRKKCRKKWKGVKVVDACPLRCGKKAGLGRCDYLYEPSKKNNKDKNKNKNKN